MADLVIIFLLAAILGGVIGYLYRAKKRGQKCIGCPYASACAKKNGCTCGKDE